MSKPLHAVSQDKRKRPHNTQLAQGNADKAAWRMHVNTLPKGCLRFLDGDDVVSAALRPVGVNPPRGDVKLAG